MRRRLAAFLCAAAVLFATPAWSACMQAEHEETAEGWLKSERFKDANGGPESAYILHLSAPACMDANELTGKIDHARTIHIFSPDKDVSKRIKRLVGKAVRVRGKPFGSHTAHHHAPIVMEVSEIAAR